MAGCFSSFKKNKGPRRKVTLLLVGLDNAGKTTAIKGIRGETLDEVAPTVGFSSIELQLDSFDITVFDLGGGRKIRGIWKNYYAEIHGVIFVIDSTAEERLKECRETLESLLNEDYIQGKRVLILANKQDQEGALDEIEICEELDLETMVNNSRCPCRVETCSAIQGTGKKVDRPLRTGFRWLLDHISEEWDELDIRVGKDNTEKRAAEAIKRKARLERAKKSRDEREKREAEERKARGEEDPADEMANVKNMQDPFKKLDNDYFEKQKKKSGKEKKKTSRKEQRDAAVVIGTDQRVDENNKRGAFVNGSFESAESDRTSNATTAAEDRVSDKRTPSDEDGIRSVQEERTEPAGKEKKKKKGKKFKKKNKVGQAPSDLAEDGPPSNPPSDSPRPLMTPAWAAPPNQRPLFRTSIQPVLETLPEQQSPKQDSLPPINGGSGHNNALPEIRSRGAKPNSEDEGVIT